MERLFEAIRSEMPKDISCRVAKSRFRSRGFFRRLYNAVEAPLRQGDVNHITGDVHFLALLLNKRKTVLTIHDCGRLDQLSGVRRAVYRWLWFDLPIRRATVVTAISEASREDILRRFGCREERVLVIHDCLPAGITPHAREFDADCPTILQVGTRANKNLGTVATALSGIRCRLDIIGRLSDEQKRCLEDNGIDYTCSHNLSDEEMLARYHACDMLAFASTSEGFGLPILEAQAIGRAVVTSDLPPMAEVGGDGACYVDPEDVKSIRNGIQRIVGDQRYRDGLIAAGFGNVKRFAPKVVAAQYAELYRELCTHHFAPGRSRE